MVDNRQFYKEISVERFHYAGFFTIILTQHMRQTEITRIFHDCWKHHMINVNVLRFEEADYQVHIYTFFPYSPNHCEYIESTYLFSMGNNSISMKNDMFPNKLRDFFNCPLLLATYSVPPYMILERLADGTYITKGIEGKLYHELAATLNFHPMVRAGKYSGDATENFDMLKLGMVNLTMFAAVNTVERSTEFTSSFPYAYASIVYTIPHGPPYTPLEKLALPFKKNVWLWVLVCTGAASATIAYISGWCSRKCRDFVFGAKNRTPFLNYINVMLGGSITTGPVRNFARTIFLIWLLGSLVLRSSYQGALFRFIQSQKSAIEIESLEELIKYNFSIYSSKQMLRLLELGSPHLSRKYARAFVEHSFFEFDDILLFFSLKLDDGTYDIMEALKSNIFFGKTTLLNFHSLFLVFVLQN